MAPLSAWFALALASSPACALIHPEARVNILKRASRPTPHRSWPQGKRQISANSTSNATTTGISPATFNTTSSALSSITPKPAPICSEGSNELMGMNNEPASWCFCAGRGPFSTIQNATTQYCQFPTLPNATISLTSHSTHVNTTCMFTSATMSLGGNPSSSISYCQCGPTVAGINLATSGTLTTKYCATGSAAPPGFSQIPEANGIPAWQAKDCSSPFFSDTTKNPADRWRNMFVDEAWQAAVAYWKANKDSGLTFIQGVSKFFNGPQGIECGKVVAKNNCNAGTACQNEYSAAGWMIMESLQLVSDMNVNFYEALQSAETSITPDIGGFSSTFAPIDNSDVVFKTILDFIALGAAVALAPVWNSLLKNFQYFKANPNTLGTIKDSINPMISQSVTITKDNSAATSSITTTNTLEHNMNGMVNIWQQTIDAVNTQMFNGSDASINSLYSLISDGKMLSGNVAISDQDAKAATEKTIYGYMIPQAWSLSNTNVSPFIIDTGVSCDQKPKTKYTPGKPLSGCVDNKLYYIVSVQGPSVSCTANFPSTCDPNPFTNVPGADVLDGKNWGGVKGDDFVASAVAGKAANGGKNGWGLIDPATAVNTESDLLVAGNGIDMAGVTKFPICGEDEAWQNWNKGHGGSNFPCNS